MDPFILSFVRELLTLPCLSFYLWYYSVPFVDGKFCLLTWRGAAITLYMTALYFGCRLESVSKPVGNGKKLECNMRPGTSPWATSGP